MNLLVHLVECRNHVTLVLTCPFVLAEINYVTLVLTCPFFVASTNHVTLVLT